MRKGQGTRVVQGCQEKTHPAGEGLLAGVWRVRGSRGQDESQCCVENHEYPLHRQHFIRQRRPRASPHCRQQVTHVLSLILNILQGVGPEKRGKGGEPDVAHGPLPFPHSYPTIPKCKEEQQLTVPLYGIGQQGVWSALQSKGFKLY